MAPDLGSFATHSVPAPDTPLVLKPSRGWRFVDLRELWSRRELIYFLVWRDLKIRYRQTAIGVAWVIIQPVLTMAIFAVIFGRVAHLPSEGIPYPVFAFAALLPWTYLAYVIQQASNSLVNNTSLITKVYFPRFALPVGVALAGLIDLGLTFVVFAVLMLLYHIHPGSQIIFLPAFLLLTVAISLGVGAWLAALNVQYRDVRYVVPFLLQVWLLLSPVGYSANLVHGKLAPVYALNPMVGAIDGFRWALLGTPPPSGQEMGLSVAVALALLVSGLLYFRRMERSIADVI